MTSRAVLLNSSVFLADNNIRRSVASLSANYPVLASASTVYRTLLPSESWTFTPASGTSASIFIVHATGSVVIDATLSDVPSVRPVTSVRFVVNRMLTLDDKLDQAVFQNAGATDIHLTIVQG